jgi:hypothetical protein
MAAVVLVAACVPPKPKIRKKQSHRPTMVAQFLDMAALRADKKWNVLEGAIPLADREHAACRPNGPITIAEFPEISAESRLFYVQYPGCCETRCRRTTKTREVLCGRALTRVACRKDALVEIRDGRQALLAASTFQQFDVTAGRPKTRIFRFDLDSDGTPEIVRWEELDQHQHVEWLVQAFRANPSGRIVRVADIRFYHSGPWKPDLNFADRNKNGTREIEIAVQDVDVRSRKVVVRRHIYRYDRLLGRYTLAQTLVTSPPGMAAPEQP